jgi:cytoskeleton protein RodZ
MRGVSDDRVGARNHMDTGPGGGAARGGSAGLDAANVLAGVNPVGPGARLATAREAHGFSLGDVARQLKLSVRQVGALERDDYDAFPSRVFVRGFLRNYAKLLQIDLEHQIVQLQASEGQVEPPSGSASGQAAPARAAPRVHWLRWALIAVLLVLVAAALFRPGPDGNVGDAIRSEAPVDDIRLSAPPRVAEPPAASAGAPAENQVPVQLDTSGVASPAESAASSEAPTQPVATEPAQATVSQTPQSTPAGE